jgi:hypothetical protein
MKLDLGVIDQSVRTLSLAFVAWPPRLFAAVVVAMLAVLLARAVRSNIESVA